MHACLEDNTACIVVATTTNPVHRMRTRHIALRFHNVREAVRDGVVSLKHVWTEHQVADIFTKSIPRSAFERFRDVLFGRVTFDEMCMKHPKPIVLDKTAEVHKMTTNTSTWPMYQIPIEQESLLGDLIA